MTERRRKIGCEIDEKKINLEKFQQTICQTVFLKFYFSPALLEKLEICFEKEDSKINTDQKKISKWFYAESQFSVITLSTCSVFYYLFNSQERIGIVGLEDQTRKRVNCKHGILFKQIFGCTGLSVYNFQTTQVLQKFLF